jgi:hypothetical protein
MGNELILDNTFAGHADLFPGYVTSLALNVQENFPWG